MEENRKETIVNKLTEHGIGIFLVLVSVTFIGEKILDIAWGMNAGLVLWIVYVLYILIGTYSKRIKPIFNIPKRIALGNLLIIPLSVTCIWGVLCIKLDVAQRDFLLATMEWLNQDDNILLLLVVFSLVVVIGYFRCYEKERVLSSTDELMALWCDCKYSDDSEAKLQKIESIDEKIGKIEDILSNRKQMGYTATCIPVKYNYENETFVFLLVKNESHKKSQWMFPGSHVEVSDNKLLDDVDLTNVEVLPSELIKEKVKIEAGLINIKLIDPNYKYVDPNESSGEEDDYKYPNTCWPVEAPVFNYLFKVSDFSNCFDNHEHRCHYDFTYVGEYADVCADVAEYEFAEIQFNLSKLKLSVGSRREDIAYIKSTLEFHINKKMEKSKSKKGGKKVAVPLDALCLDSIPQMIYNTILFYKDYKNIKK